MNDLLSCLLQTVNRLCDYPTITSEPTEIEHSISISISRLHGHGEEREMEAFREPHSMKGGEYFLI
jgi:hypothetical protein